VSSKMRHVMSARIRCGDKHTAENLHSNGWVCLDSLMQGSFSVLGIEQSMHVICIGPCTGAGVNISLGNGRGMIVVALFVSGRGRLQRYIYGRGTLDLGSYEQTNCSQMKKYQRNRKKAIICVRVYCVEYIVCTTESLIHFASNYLS